jgi:hypothetical protein
MVRSLDVREHYSLRFLLLHSILSPYKAFKNPLFCSSITLIRFFTQLSNLKMPSTNPNSKALSALMNPENFKSSQWSTRTYQIAGPPAGVPHQSLQRTVTPCLLFVASTGGTIRNNSSTVEALAEPLRRALELQRDGLDR